MIEDPVFGFDISGHKPFIDWQRVKKAQIEGKKVTFCQIKKTQGTWFISATWRDQYDGAVSVEIPVSFYHFFEGREEAQKEMDFFFLSMPDFDFKLCIDFESTYWLDRIGAISTLRRLEQSLEIVTARIGEKPLVYTAQWFINKVLESVSVAALDFLKEYPLQVAHYPYDGFSATFPIRIPKPWEEQTVWQYAESGRLDGVTNYLGYPTSVDLDVMEKAEWEAMFGVEVPTEDPIQLLNRAVVDIEKAMTLI